MVVKVAILGAGVVGLSTGIRLLEVWNSIANNEKLDISIIADKFAESTTSDGAGGLFRVDDRFMPGVPRDIASKWIKNSFEYYDRLLFSGDGGKAGIFQTSGYQMFDEERPDPGYKDYVYQFRHMTEKELNDFPKKYKLVSKGVKLIEMKLSTLDNFISNNDYNIVFNCLGLGAINFCNDKLMVPIRGQMIRVNAPWIKHFYYTDDNCYIIPNINTICLGGTRQVGNFSLNLDESDSKGIFERCKELCPSLENAKIEWQWVGLRPQRTPTRVEKEILKNKNGNEIIVIHNYGHGGNGISISRGTSIDAVDLLIKERLKSKL